MTPKSSPTGLVGLWSQTISAVQRKHSLLQKTKQHNHRSFKAFWQINDAVEDSFPFQPISFSFQTCSLKWMKLKMAIGHCSADGNNELFQHGDIWLSCNPGWDVSLWSSFWRILTYCCTLFFTFAPNNKQKSQQKHKQPLDRSDVKPSSWI